MKAKIIGILMLVFGATFGWSQGFMNLDFENPILPLVPVNFQVPTSNAVPGWTAYAYGNPESSVIYNTLSLGAPAVSLQGPGSLQPVLQGNYTVYLQSPSFGPSSTSAIGQTGKIPLTAQSLIFYGVTALQVTFEGQPIPLIQLGTGPGYQIVGGDISAFAGQTGELKFVLPQLSFDAMSPLDNIQFSPSTVPEPSTLALGAVGVLLVGFRRWRQFRP